MTAAFVLPTSLASATPQLQAQQSLSAVWSIPTTIATTTPSLIVSDNTAAATTVTFEPILPDVTTLIGMGVIVTLCIVAAVVWNNQVVPVSRTKLAISKSRGDVKDYLDDLQADDDDDRKLEQWLFTDWLQEKKSSSKKPAALPFLKKAKWNSGDNPVVVTAGIMMVGIVVASITERVL